MAGAEGAVDLEAIGIIEEGAAQREEHFLRSEEDISMQPCKPSVTSSKKYRYAAMSHVREVQTLITDSHTHLKLLHPFQPVQIRHQPDPVFQRPQELHLELHHLPEVPEQNVQLQHREDHFDPAAILEVLFKFGTNIFLSS